MPAVTPRKILIVQGHPDPSPDRFGRALTAAYRQAAQDAGHQVEALELATLEFPWLRSQQEWKDSPPPEAIRDAQQRIQWADHLVIAYPLWLGDMPALMKAFLEQTLRPGFAMSEPKGRLPQKLLGGRSARVIVTMGMPALAYRLFYRGHTLKSLKRNILHFCGIRPVRTSLVGSVEGSARGREGWIHTMARLGRRGC